MKLDALTAAVECDVCGALVVDAALHRHREFHELLDQLRADAAW